MNTRTFLRIVLNLRSLLLVAAALAVRSLPAQTAPFYINDGVVLCPPQVPPQIDALEFINNGNFSIQSILSSLPYTTQNTINFTNRGTMDSSSGFSFMTHPNVGGAVQANSFHNSGTINSGVDSLYTFLVSGWAALPQTRINARTIVNPGTISLGGSTLLGMNGDNVDLNRATLLMSTSLSGFTGVTPGGIFDSYWGMNKVRFDAAYYFGLAPPLTPLHWVTNRYATGLSTNLALTASQTSLYLPTNTFYLTQQQAGSNIWTYGVFLYQSDPAITNAVYMDPQTGWTTVQWSWAGTDPGNGAPMTNSFYLLDMFGSISNMIVLTNGFVDALPTFIPTNYYFSSFPYIFGPPANPGSPNGLFPVGAITNDYAAYQAYFLPNTVIPGETYGSTIENLPGRVELNGTSVLNLTRARVSADNTIMLRATNHFIGTRADISAPFIDLDLATTNGSLTISNLIAPSLARPTGTVSLFSTRWIVTQPDGFTNNYCILFVDSELQPTSGLLANLVQLRSPNVFISDFLTINSNLLITATNLTIATNAPGSPTPYGALTIQNDLIFLPTAFPLLQNLTNFGVIKTPGNAVFAGLRSPPYYSSGFTESYKSLVNRGWIMNQGTQIRAEEFVNSGVVDAGVGPIEIITRNARLSGGSLLSPAGDVSLLATNALLLSNLTMTVGRTLKLDAGTLLDDGSLSTSVGNLRNRNFWTVGRGFNLPQLPTSSSLLGTTLTNLVPAYQQVPNVWSGVDKGTNVLGYQNNAALGRLVLNGGTNCSFAFAGSGPGKAIYVDRLELEGYAAVKDVNNDLDALEIAPDFRIYYAEALVDGVSQAEKLNGHNNGRLIWVNSYAGFFSSTNITYPNGRTYAVNSGLAASCNLDSDNDGLVNCIDPTPVAVPGYCDISLAPTAASYAFEGGDGLFSVQDTNFCGYAAFTTNTWISIVGGASGTGFGQVRYRVGTNTSSVTRTGRILVGTNSFTVTQTAGGWVTSPIFGQLYYAGDGWYGGSAYGWLWYSEGPWIWSTALQGWLARMGDSQTLWSIQFRWLTPSTSDRFQATTSTLGLVYVSQYQGTTIPEGWVFSPRFGYVWAAGDGNWFYTTGYGWLGVTPDGGIWCVDQNRFL